MPDEPSDPVEKLKLAFASMEVIAHEYMVIAKLLAELLLIVSSESEDEAEIGRRVKRLLEDYGMKMEGIQ